MAVKEELDKLIRQILGDFPEGFNAGASAGLLGWPGDMLMMADTARLAITGERSQRPPEEYPLTTDAIAAAAGYPVPKSVSGQLGAAVGGLLSPSPGDLAKFAPLLSAIPFWHGSPHKFEAFDLAHMGKGEGAQAYGWGAYGADSADVAKNYVPRDHDVEGDLLRLYSAAEQRQDYDAMQVFEDAMLHKTANEISEIYPERQFADAIEKVRVLERKQKGNLYRGEYAWPDPAKEAATPLTGEDLLQWDRPLSEQGQAVRQKLSALARSNPEFMSQLERHGMGQMHGDVAYAALQENAARDEKYRRMIAGEVEPFALDNDRAQRIASEILREAGIPGIRYLDGMSRDGGSGTYNYVMFDDQGIKLLERNGKPLGGLLSGSDGLLGSGAEMFSRKEVFPAAEDLAEKLRQMGVDAHVRYSQTNAGNSAYIEWRRQPSLDGNPFRDGRIPPKFLGGEIRVSDHSTGPARHEGFSHSISSIDDVASVETDLAAKISQYDEWLRERQSAIDSTPSKRQMKRLARNDELRR